MSIRKNILVTVLIFTLLAASFTAGTLTSKPSYATITSEGNWSVPGDYIEGGLEEYTFTVTQSGTYLIELTGEQGGPGMTTGYRLNSYQWGALGGNISGTIDLTVGDVLTTTIAVGSAGGSRTSGDYVCYGGKGGDSISVSLNSTLLMTAGGGAGGAGQLNGQIQPTNRGNTGIPGPGTPGNTTTTQGTSGANYINTSLLSNTSEPHTARTPGFRYTLISSVNGVLNRENIITSTHAISTQDSNGNSGFIFAGTVSKSATIEEDGFYIIECSGQGHQFVNGYSSSDGQVNYGGRILARIFLNEGDYIQSYIVPGGPSHWNDVPGIGGNATLITINGIPVVGAGGSGGHGYDYSSGSSTRNYFQTGQSVTTTNNLTFSSGGGGGRARYVSGVSSQSLNLEGSSGSGGTGVAGVAQGGGAGTNYLDTNLATLISEPNNGRNAYYIVKKEGARDYIPKLSLGKYSNIGNLAIVDDLATNTDTCKSFTAQLPYALYEITLNGGLYGGSLVGSMMLKQGDKLYFTQIPTYISGGNGGYLGGNAVSVYYDDVFSTDPEVLIAGVGGGAMNANDTGVGQAGGNKTIYYNYGEFTEMTGTVGSSIFGSGGSSTTQAPGNPGADGLIYDLYKNGASPGEGAANFVDTGYLTSYTSSPNSGVTIPTGNFSIRLVSLGTPDQIAAIETLKNIADLQKRLTVLEAPIITCQDGVPFETRVHTYSHITHTAIAVDGIQVLNEDLEDGYIVVKGSVNGVGYHDIFIHGLKFTFNVLESPNSSNVNVLLE